MRGLTPNDIGRGRESYRRPVATRRRRVRCSRSVTGRRPVSRTSHLMALFQGTEAPGPKLNAPRQKSAPLTHVRGALVLCWRFYKAMEFCGPFVRLWASPTSSVSAVAPSFPVSSAPACNLMSGLSSSLKSLFRLCVYIHDERSGQLVDGC